MKEATGELSGTVITIASIALIAAVFAALLLPTLRAQIVLSQACTNGPSYKVENDDGSSVDCKGPKSGTDTLGNREWDCYYHIKNSEKVQKKTCKERS